MNLQAIQNIVAEPMKAFDDGYRRQMQSSVTIINDIGEYLSQRKGKMLRPLLTLLAAGVANDTVADTKVQMAIAMELLHNSTLIHDDVVDESDRRRGMETICHRWSNQIAVLCGDYYLAKVMHLLCLHASYEERDIISRTAIEMSEGELLQQQSSRDTNMSETQYLETIYKKTASLMASCCEVGAWNDRDASMSKRLREFGRLFGLAFQMRDDVLDYCPEAQTGKPCGNDIKERKMTLPLIYYYHTASNEEQQQLLRLLQQGDITDEEAARMVSNVHDSDAIRLTQKKISETTEQARQLLETLPHSPYRDGLMQLTDFLLQ